jgi:hypothetical protein
MSAAPQPISYQQGGIMNSFEVLMLNMDSPAKLLYGFVLILVIAYSAQIPTEYRVFTDSLLGRVLGIAILYGVVHTFGWVYGLLTALVFVLILQSAPRVNRSLEGFDGGGGVAEKRVVRGKRWFVEQVLNEDPKKIATDRVTTSAIED